jgi:hypothetical protein
MKSYNPGEFKTKQIFFDLPANQSSQSGPLQTAPSILIFL